MAANREALAGYGLAIAYALHQAVSHDCVLVFACHSPQAMMTAAIRLHTRTAACHCQRRVVSGPLTCVLHALVMDSNVQQQASGHTCDGVSHGSGRRAPCPIRAGRLPVCGRHCRSSGLFRSRQNARLCRVPGYLERDQADTGARLDGRLGTAVARLSCSKGCRDSSVGAEICKPKLS